MTQEQLEKGNYLKEEIRYIRARLDSVENFIKNYDGNGMCGLNTGQALLAGEYIYPNNIEINAMLTLMKDRYENHIAELEKELEEL